MSKKITLAKILKLASNRVFDYDINTKLKKDDIIDLSTRVAYYINSSSKNLKVSRLEGIPSNEEIVIDDEKNYRIETTVNKSTVQKMITLLSEINDNETQTVVIPLPKKKASKIEEHPFIKWIKDISTFESVYYSGNIEEKWIDLNDDKTGFTNVLYLPDIYIFMNGKKIRTKPFKINLLIVAIPSKYNAKNGIDEMNDYEYIRKIIDDTMDACIKLGLKHIVINPFSLGILKDSAYAASEYWNSISEQQRVIENVENIVFTISDDDLYIVFRKSK